MYIYMYVIDDIELTVSSASPLVYTVIWVY